MKYLGMPLFIERLRARFWDGILEYIYKKLAGWKGKLLTYVARFLLIKNTLSSIPMYSAFIFKMLINIVKEIDAKYRKFLWSNNLEQRKFFLVKWGKSYKEKMKGGLGLRRMKVLN